MLVDIDLEALAIASVLPVSDGVADAVEERAAAEIEPANEHPAQMTDVADVVAAGAESAEEFYGTHNCNVRPHRDCDRQGNQPNASVGKQNSIGDQYAEDSS